MTAEAPAPAPADQPSADQPSEDQPHAAQPLAGHRHGAQPLAERLVVAPPTRGQLAWYRLARAVVIVPSWFMWRMRFTGLENLPQTTPYVLAPVHRSYIDTLLAGYVSTRRVRFMGKEEMWQTPWVAKLFSSLGGFPVRRGTPDREALRICEQILAAGEPVVLFPEGSRQSGPIVQPLFAGPAFVAVRANVPIVPLGIGGSEKAMPKGAKWLRPTRIALAVGRPIWPPPAADGERVPRRVVSELTDRLQTELQEVFDTAQALAGV
jgi:1-acyl-sn-glycerol-3-phosphate acyltransferase